MCCGSGMFIAHPGRREQNFGPFEKNDYLFVEHQVGSLEVGVGCAYRAGVQPHVTISVGFELEQQTAPSPNMFGRGNKLLVILEPGTMESLQIRSNGIKFRDKKESS